MPDATMLGTNGPTVVQVHRRLLVLGITVPPDELREDRFGPGTEAAIRRLQAQWGLPLTGAIDAATAQQLSLGDAPARTLRGIVSKPGGEPLAGIVVQLVQVRLRDEAVLGETKSGADGAFSLSVPAGAIGLAVRAAGNPAQPIAPTAGVVDAWVRLTIGGAYRGASRFTALADAIAPVLGSVAPATLGDNGRTAEWATVAAAANVAAADVARYTIAHKLAAQTKVAPAAWFALFAQGVPATLQTALAPGGEVALDDTQVARVLDTVLQLRPVSVRAALDAAVAANAVADLDVDAAAKQLATLRLARIAARPFRLGKTPLRDILATVLPAAAAQDTVVAAYAEHGTGAAFWTALEQPAGLPAPDRDALKFTLRATVLLRNHLPLLKRVQAMRASGKITGTADLAKLEAADWGRLIRETDPTGADLSFTKNLQFPTLDARLDHFAEMVASHLERRHPTAAFAGRVAKHGAALGLAAPDAVQHFLAQSPTFSLRRTHIDRFVKDHPEVDHAAIADLKRVQRVYKVSRSFAHASAMLANGFASAHSVYAAGKKRFVATMGAAGVTPGAARTIYARSTQAHATTIAMLGTFNRAMTAVTPAAVAKPLTAAALAPLVASFPSLQSLFGSTDYCSCEHCRSIYGPAAYLVDILEFLKHRAATGGTARDVLLGRRADLGAIELSCENTNDVLPYIDLTCEVLEDAVAAPATGAVRARQTTGTAEELRANPRFVNAAAYDTLRAAVYPPGAPFDLWTAETRAYLRQLGVAWHELLAALRGPTSTVTDAQIAGERLGFNAGSRALATDPAPAAPWTYWGLAAASSTIHDPRKPGDATATITGSWDTLLAIVPLVLERARIVHRELLQLLQARFVNPTGTIVVVENSPDGLSHCDVGLQAVQTWTVPALVHFQQLLRLWRQLGRPIWDLDKALVSPAIANGTLDANGLAHLGQLDAVAARLAIPWDEALGLWGDLDHADAVNVLDDAEPRIPSVYARRFRNAAVLQSSPVFVADPVALTGLLGSPAAIAGISAALGLGVDDIARIRTAAGLAAATAPLTLASTSALFRHATLASALRLSIADLEAAIAVTGVDPFASPATTLAFLDALDRVRETGFSLLELHYLLRHGSVLDAGIALADSTIAAWLDDVRVALIRGGANPAQRVADLLNLDPVLAQLAMQRGATPIATLFADPRLVQRAADGTLSPPSDRASFGALFDALTVLDKVRAVLGRWRAGTRDGSWLFAHAAEVGWLDLFTLPPNAASHVALAAFADLHANLAMQQTLVAPDETRLFDVVLQRAAPRNTVAAALAALGGWATADVIAIADAFGWTTGASLVAGGTAPHLRDLLAWPRKLGTDAATALSFETTAATIATAQQARQLAKARYSIADWYAVAGSIQDGIREQKRAALVAWLLAHPDAARGQAWADVEELYGFYLIDPEMSAWALTTRIKQAAASVQLFVQRCLLQREPRVTVNADTDDGWDQWDWMKRFRLWEANRKIFLYPENWIDPSQRGAKSPFFTDLEATLQQGDMTDDAAEDALLAYLHQLADVSHLEIVGVCQQLDFGERLLHVVGRTRKAPHVHYYRRLGSTGVWSPWEKLDAEIEGDHVLPVFWNRRLHVFWPQLAEKTLPTTPQDRKIPTSTSGGTASEPSTYWEISLAWVEKRQDRWMPKRVAGQVHLAARDEGRLYTLKAPVAGRRITVDLYRALSPSNVVHYAQWQLSSAEDEPVLLHSGLGPLAPLEAARNIGDLPVAQRKPALLSSSTLDWDHNALAAAPGAVSLSLIEGFPQQDLTVLQQIARAKVIGEHQDPQFASQSPFFVSDPQRTFFVTPSFVATTVYSRTVPSGTTTYTTQYAPVPFYHPYVDTFLQELAFGGVDGLYARRLQTSPDVVRGAGTFDFAATYKPTAAVNTPYPVEAIDYSHDGAYAAYNWELFFHVPLLMAKRLADNQQFEDALRWFHFIFDPTATTGGAAPQRYWMPKMLSDLTATDFAQQQIEQLLQLVNSGDAALAQKVAAWRADPFDPHLIAASRPVAYQKAVVMQYIATLVAWGDQLFRGDTIETINEATQLYITASELLGPRPQDLRSLQPRAAQTYTDLAPKLDAFGNALVDIENVISPPRPDGPPPGAPLPQLHTFYFCIPPNEQLLAYWDTVADRLFKLRNGLDIDGVARPLALYEPAIDPGLLVRAAAAGVNVSAVAVEPDSLRAPYRFTRCLQAALELSQDVRGLGAAIASALAQRDAEQLSRVRATQEIGVLDALRAVKSTAVADAQAARTILERGRDLAVIRRDYYGSRDLVNPAELTGLALAGAAITAELAALLLDGLATGAHLVPAIQAGAAGFGGSPTALLVYGGPAIANSSSSAANVLRGAAAAAAQAGGVAATFGGYQRRRDEWELQKRLADKEIEQLDRNLASADLRIEMAQKELDAHDRQLADAKTTSELLESKFTNRELYDWLVSQLSTTYFQAYQLAYDLAKRASKAYAFELDGVEPGYIQFGYWDNLHKGLHAGEKLALDLRRLEADYLARNSRELELTKHVPLTQLDPAALVELRRTGQCFIDLHEGIFDLDYPGHYMRRLKSVSVTLPCVTGPYTGVNATLTLLTHATRRSADPAPQYLPAVDADGVPLDSDPRFSRGPAATSAVALSTGRDDAGLFEVNFHDERYLPFEGRGAVSHWRLEVPRDTNRFDLSTLTDVVLHLRYTARDGGAALRDAARAAVTAALPRAGTLLVSARTEFPDAWARLFAPIGADQQLSLPLTAADFPYLPASQRYKLGASKAILVLSSDQAYADYAAGTKLKLATGAAFAPDAALGQLPAAAIAPAADPGTIALAFHAADIAAASTISVGGKLDRTKLEDILLLVSYTVEARP